jgi:hypothetical protein
MIRTVNRGSNVGDGIQPVSEMLSITFDAGKRELPILGASRRLAEAGIHPPLRMADILPTRALEDFERWVYQEFADSDPDELTSSTYLTDLNIMLPKLGWAVVGAAKLDMPAVEDRRDSIYQPMPFTLVFADFSFDRQDDSEGKKVRGGLFVMQAPSRRYTALYMEHRSFESRAAINERVDAPRLE